VQCSRAGLQGEYDRVEFWAVRRCEEIIGDLGDLRLVDLTVLTDWLGTGCVWIAGWMDVHTRGKVKDS